MDELFLIYIVEVGKDWKGTARYEFLFSDTTKDIDGDEWDAIPASGRPESPHEHLVKKVGILISDEKRFNLIQNSDTFSVWDAIDGVVAMAWENMDDYEEYPESRIAFHFGDTIKEVEGKLYEHDLTLEYKREKNGKLKNEDKE